MKELRIRIIFRSGRKMEITSHEYYEGQFTQWCIRNFVKSDGNNFEFVIWNDCFINLNEVEKIEEIKD